MAVRADADEHAAACNRWAGVRSKRTAGDDTSAKLKGAG